MSKNFSLEDNPSVLFIDPDPELLQSYTGYFQYLHKMEVAIAVNKKTALKCIDMLTRPTIVVLERWLDVLGETLIPELRFRSHFPLMFIVQSDDRSTDFELRALAAGAFWVIPKDRRNVNNSIDKKDKVNRGKDRRGTDRSLEILLAYIRLAQFVVVQMTMPHYDKLTGAANRHLMYNDAVRELSHAVRMETETACLLVDVDKLKYANDTYGHLAGDRVVVCVADSIQEHVRSTDIWARTGGDEFVLILPDTGIVAAEHFAELTCKTIASKDVSINPKDPSKGVMRVSVSIGITILSADRINATLLKLSKSKSYLGKRQQVLIDLLDEVIGEADAAMYVAKRAKKAYQ